LSLPLNEARTDGNSAGIELEWCFLSVKAGNQESRSLKIVPWLGKKPSKLAGQFVDSDLIDICHAVLRIRFFLLSGL